MRVSDYVINRLFEVGIKQVYSITGRGSLFLNDAVAKHPGILNIATHHEQAAGYAAIAESQYSEKLSACLVSTGCASTTAITPVLCAWQDANPTIFVSGQNFLEQTTNYSEIQIRTFGQQEANIVELVTPITKYAKMITSADEIQEELEKAIIAATTGRKGPVWIDIPIDIQNKQFDPKPQEEITIPLPLGLPELKTSQIQMFADLIKNSQQPLFLIGHGIVASGSVELFDELVTKNKVPFVFTPSSVDALGTTHPNSIGAVGVMGCSRAANIAIQNCDLLIVLGSRLNSMITGENYGDFARNAKIVVVDIDAIEHSKPMPPIDLFINFDAFQILENSQLWGGFQDTSKWLEKCQISKARLNVVEKEFSRKEKVDLYELSKSLSRVLPQDATVVTDSGLVELILPTNIDFRKGQRCIHPTSQGAMGYALPAAIGVQQITATLVLAVIGDGSVMMNLQEFQTITDNDLPIKIIIINNNVYSVIRKRQTELFRNRTIGTDPSNGVGTPDFKELSKLFNFSYVRIENAVDLDEQLSGMLELPGKVLCEVMGFSDQNYIQTGTGRDSDGKLIRLPIEDQVPRLPAAVLELELL